MTSAVPPRPSTEGGRYHPETYFIDPDRRITAKYIGALSQTILAARLAEAAQGIIGTEGKGRDYQSISVR